MKERYELGDLVEVYDPDERQWFPGIIEAIQFLANQPEEFYIVKLDDKPLLTERSFTTFLTPKARQQLDEGTMRMGVIAVPTSRAQGWLKPRSS